MRRIILALAGGAVLAAAGPLAAGGKKPVVETPPDDVVFVDDVEVVEPVTNQRGKPFRGLEAFIDRRAGNCVACHTNFDVQAMQFLGNVGPNLDWVGERFTRAELRAIIVDSKRVFGEDTLMPAFYVSRSGLRTPEELKGKPILTAQQVEDMVAYLYSLQR